jgi:hypothetical protein
VVVGLNVIMAYYYFWEWRNNSSSKARLKKYFTNFGVYSLVFVVTSSWMTASGAISIAGGTVDVVYLRFSMGLLCASGLCYSTVYSKQNHVKI